MHAFFLIPALICCAIYYLGADAYNLERGCESIDLWVSLTYFGDNRFYEG